MPVAADIQLCQASAIGVGGERHRRVEGEVGRHLLACEALRIERQISLQAQQRVGEQRADDAEHQHGEGVGCPLHVLVFIDAEELVEESLDRPQNRCQKGALALEDPGHVGSQRLGKEQEHAEEQRHLQYPIRCHHGLLKLLRLQQRVDQVNEEQNGHDPGQDVVCHPIPPSPISRSRV
jgi:hypothetical protein